MFSYALVHGCPHTSPEGDEGRIDLIHLDVPDQDYEGVFQGWEKYYWTPCAPIWQVCNGEFSCWWVPSIYMAFVCPGKKWGPHI